MIGLSEPEKPQMPKQVWPSLCSHPDSFALPQWHSDVLVERRQRILDGSATRIPWNEAKAQLQRLT